MRGIFKYIIIYASVLTLFFFRDFTKTYLQSDFIAYWLPHYKFLLDSLTRGEIPLWQPYSFLGLPELFKLELGTFYPPVWVLLVANTIFNPDININFLGKSLEFLQYINLLIGAVGMYILLYKSLKLKELPAFFGGLIFVLSIHTTAQIWDLSTLPSKLYLPWIIYLLDRFVRNNSYRNYVFLVSINFVILTLGYPYHWFYFSIVQLVYALFFGKRSFVYTVLATVNSVLLASFFLLSNYHILSQSFRQSSPSTLDSLFHLQYAFIPTRIINLINPIMYGALYSSKDPHQLYTTSTLHWGTIPYIFLVIGLAGFRSNRKSKWTVLIFLGGLLFSLGGYLDVPGLLGVVMPVVNRFRSHTQALTLTYFTGTIILSVGLDNILQGKYYKKTMFFLWQFFVFLCIFLISRSFTCNGTCTSGVFDLVVSQSRSLILMGIGLIATSLYLKTRWKGIIYLAILVTIFEFSLYNSKFSHFRSPVSYSSYYDRDSLLVEMPSNSNMFRYMFMEHQYGYNTSFMGVFNAQGYETVPYKAYYSLLNLGEESFLRFSNTKYLITTNPNKESNSEYLKLRKIIRPIDHPDDVYFGPTSGLPYYVPQKDNPYYIYEVLNYLPRFYVPQRVVSCNGSNCDLSNPELTSFVRDGDSNLLNPSKDTVKILINYYSANNIKLRVDSSKETFIASSEIWDKGWNLTINGDRKNLIKVNEGFRAFIVPAGRNEVDMKYIPPYLFEGLVLSLAGLFALFCYRFALNRTR